MFGVMIDCSRNAVMNPEAVKRFAEIIKNMGYDTLMLYTEDTYEVKGEPLFGAMRGKYIMDEIKDIDNHCRKIGIELVPCIQTLAHLGGIFKWKEYAKVRDCEDIFLCESDETYNLIEKMIDSVAESFSSRKIHIGMDEAFWLGEGRYRQIYGMKDPFDILNAHLHRVCKILEKYNFEPMIWSDMFLRHAMENDDYYCTDNMEKINERPELPEKVSLVYWDYHTHDYDSYAKMLKANKLFNRKVYFAGASWTWRGIAPDNTFSMETTKIAISACKEEGVDGMFITTWGDDGGECSPFAVLPSLMYASEVAHGNNDIDSIKSKFQKITENDFDSFMLFDKLNTPGGKHQNSTPVAKYILYNDLFTGIKDNLCSNDDCEYYENLSRQLATVSSHEFKDFFNMYKSLCDVLSVKANLGNETRTAYRSGDKKTINNIISKYEILQEKIEIFYKSYRQLWFKRNKPQGFDIQDIRIGGLIQRIKSCKDRLTMYLNGEVDCIPELIEDAPKGTSLNVWSRIVSPNVVAHYL